MNRREARRTRDRALDALSYAQQQEARAAWGRAFESCPKDRTLLKKDVDRARLAMLTALADGQPIPEAEKIARLELARAG